jgi:threonine aldolase
MAGSAIYSLAVSRPIDLRSDTVTTPTPQMRRAMAEAEVGDDWYGDDPTVNRLERRAAEVTGKEAAVFVATGTMANQLGLHVLARSGHLVVCEATAHVGTTEVATSAVLSGLSFIRIVAPRGQLTADLVEPALRPDPYGVDVVDLLTVENTHGFGGGTVMPVEELRHLRKAAMEAGVPVYMDGARIFNASAASGAPVSEYAAEVDAMMFCLSKGLGAPIGSVLCGPAALVEEARRAKVLFGGAWRQAGIVAAAGLVALEEGPERLHEDHANARRLAEGVADASPGVTDPKDVQTNIVFADCGPIGLDPWEVVARLRHEGVLANVLADRIRLMTHRDVSVDDVDAAVAAWRQVVSSARAGDRSSGETG